MLELRGLKQIGFRRREGEREGVARVPRGLQRLLRRQKSFFDELKDQYREVREKKQALLEEAEQLKDSTAWRQTATTG